MVLDQKVNRINCKRKGYTISRIHVPYGDDWFAYFMRRLAERPQNLSLAVKEFVKPAGLKRVGIIAALGATVMLGLSTIKKLCRK